MTNQNDIATLFFTELKVESEIQKIRQKIKAVRVDTSLPDPIRDLELARLFEVHNMLEVEFMRQQEDYLKQFLQSLNLEEIKVKPMSEGTLKCHLLQQTSINRQKNRSKSSGFIDAFSDGNINPDGQMALSSDIISQRKSEINFELRKLSFKETLTPEEKQKRQDLLKTLHNITG